MHDVLFAPKRKQYLKENTPDVDCIFCAIRDKNPDVWTREIYRDDKAIVIMNIYPYSPGHIQILPQKHVEDIGKLPEDVTKRILELIQQGMTLTEKTMNPIGWNIGINLGEAGASISHLHIQIVPRFKKKVEENQEEIHNQYLKNTKIFETSTTTKQNLEKNCDCLSNTKFVLKENPKIYLCRKPYNRGHLVISPTSHLNDPRNLYRDEIYRLSKSVVKAKELINEIYNPVGINIGSNIGDVPNTSEHLKVHIVPRYDPESGFMEVVGNSRVVTESLDKSYERLKSGFN